MGKLFFEDGRFHFEPSKDRQRAKRELALVKDAAFHLDRTALRWATRNIDKAVKLRRFADPSAEIKFKKYFITACEPPECIEYPDHLTPRPFQLESAWHALTRTPSYIADEAGLGKTITAILCMNSVPGRALVICPPYLKENWRREILKWRPEHMDMVDLTSDAMLTNEAIQKLIRAQNYKWLFVDEAHRFKEATAKRTEALIGRNGICDLAERVVFLSGTPTPNRPIELYPILDGVAPEAIQWRSKHQYGIEFCGGKQVKRFEGNRPVVNWDYSGRSNLKGLRKELRSKFMIRHLKRDVMPELPAKTRQLIFLDQPKNVSSLEKKLLKEHSLEELLGEGYNLGDVATYRKELGDAKVLPAFLYISELLENTKENLVIFAHHIAVVEELTRLLKPHDPLTVRGGISAKEKDARIREFQSNSKRRLVVGNIDSMGVGNTLTRATRCIFVEYSWVHGTNEQAEDRLHRIGQKDNVYSQYLVMRDSLDERMLRKVLQKQDDVNTLMS